MKIVKTILFGIVVLIVIVLVAALFIKREYKVEREISINKSRKEVFDYIKFLKNQNEYSVWARIDPAMKKTFTGVDGTVGFISAWDSKVKDAGKGEQEIKKMKEGERIDYEIRFKDPLNQLILHICSLIVLMEIRHWLNGDLMGKCHIP